MAIGLKQQNQRLWISHAFGPEARRIRILAYTSYIVLCLTAKQKRNADDDDMMMMIVEMSV